jgi:malate dehydrogenase (oxaloacetate-decarboxylating)(NADP+)
VGPWRGIAHEEALAQMRRNTTLIGAMLLRNGRAVGTYKVHLQIVTDVIGPREGVQRFAAMHLLMLPEHTVFIAIRTLMSSRMPSR